MNQHVAIKVAKIDIQRALSSLEVSPGFDPEDHTLKLDTLEGETDLYEVVSALLADNEDDEGLIDALDAQVDARAIRIERAKARIDARKKAIVSLMDCAQEKSLKLPEATLSVRTLQPRPKVADASELPDEFVTVETVRKPNLEAIKSAFEHGASIPGVTVTNGGASLTVRRK